ncbi:MAG: cation diffusion facilitator family transporter [Bacilli bacterium]|nr:cation diffusion facilitator family transporter [Bacilli bacterium]
MIKFIIKKTIKDCENVTNNDVRQNYTILGGVLGIICNLFLFIVKLTSGIFLNSIAIISDAFNNFSDMGSSIVALVGAKMSSLKPDKEHPFGHGRFEYISSFIVSFIIIYVGIELFRNSLDKIINPSEVNFSWIIFIILCLSVLVKVWMYSYNKYMGKKTNNPILKATAQDSLNDVISTSVVIVSLLIMNYVTFPLDGIMGVIVSILILKSGYDIAKETISLLLGEKPSKELVESIERIILSHNEIIGIHDLLVHDYGPGRVFASCHAEVLDTFNITKAHEVIDYIEEEINRKLNIIMVIHMDPISLNNEKLNIAKETIKEVIRQYGNIDGHDYRLVDGENQINIIFDLVIPFDETKDSIDKIIDEIKEKLKEKDNRYNLVIKIENKYHE